jgi:hypothetical protein
MSAASPAAPGLLDVALVHQQQVVHQARHHLLGDLARRAHGYALGDGGIAHGVLRALHGVDHGRKALRLHAHHLDAQLERLGRRGHARDEAAAAHGEDEHVQPRLLAQHLQRQRALACGDGLVVVGVHEGQALLMGELVGMRACFLQRVAVQHHLGAEAARALHLHAGREARHDDHRAHAQALCVVGHALGMVARAHRHHAARALAGRELREPIARAAFLERGGELQVLELEEHLRAYDLGERLGFHAGRLQHVAAQAFGGGLDVLEAEHPAIVAPTSRPSLARCRAAPVPPFQNWCRKVMRKLRGAPQ